MSRLFNSPSFIAETLLGGKAFHHVDTMYMYLCEGSRRTKKGRRRGGMSGRGERGDEEEEKEGEKEG